MTTLLGYFYTDVYGLDAATVATLFLVVRIFDAITDPLMGGICERTETRWGKYRPYLLVLTIPYAIASVLVFTVPELEGTAKTVYAYVTYSVLMVLFTGINIPYGAMTGVMTDDPQERTSLNSVRFMFSSIGALTVTSFVLPMAELWDDPAIGYQYAMMIMAAISVVLYVICFAATKERITPAVPDKDERKFSQDLITVFKNDQFRWVAIITMVMVTIQAIKGTAILYYVNEVVHDGTSWATYFLVTLTVGNVFGAPLASKLIKKVDKKLAWAGLHLILVLLSLLAYFVDENIYSVLAIQFCYGFFVAMIAPIWFTYIADSVDYGEVQFGVRYDALATSLTIFALKLGLSIGGAACLYYLSFYDYQSGGVEQSATAVEGIRQVFSVVPALGFLFTSFLIYRFLKLDSKTIKENAARLTQFRAEKA